MNMTADCIPARITPPLKTRFFENARGKKTFGKIIVGGGPAATFTAYEILKQAEKARKKISVLMLTDKFNSPCAAGSQVVPMTEGVFTAAPRTRRAINTLMHEAFTSLEQTIKREKIKCRFDRGYEIKSKQQDGLIHAIDSMIDCGIFERSDIAYNSRAQIFNLPGHDYSALIRSKAGQVDMHELLRGLRERIRNMGGTIIRGARYEGQETNDDITVHTDIGEFKTSSPPLLATGAIHQKTLKEFNDDDFTVIHTMCIVIGPLSPTDTYKVSRGPMAVTDDVLIGDFFWGGLDSKRYLTIGRGDTTDPSDKNRDRTARDILNQIETYYPGLTKKYHHTVSFGPMLFTKNMLPVVGRMNEYDIAGGWGSMGVVPSKAAADAYAPWIIEGDDEKLKLFESFHAEKFSARTPINLDGPVILQGELGVAPV
jgi:glycine/D-amino acid oxidase-like deaminating enzyme